MMMRAMVWLMRGMRVTAVVVGAGALLGVHRAGIVGVLLLSNLRLLLLMMEEYADGRLWKG